MFKFSNFSYLLNILCCMLTQVRSSCKNLRLFVVYDYTSYYTTHYILVFSVIF